MRNIKLTFEYDGTNYFGWQTQSRGPTIEKIIEYALEKITKNTPKLIGSGRTDAGVHALGQVANFKTKSELTILQFQKALNSILPKDIVVIKSEEVDMDFHSQFDAKSKVYTYRILNRPFPSSLQRLSAWFIPHSLDIDQMQKAAQVLLGEHDFSAFALSTHTLKSTIREVLEVKLEEKGVNILEFEIESTGFLKRMVRLIVGTLVQVGKNRITTGDFSKILESGEKTKYIRAAPPRGLYLKEVKY